jgi:hypothetical protein
VSKPIEETYFKWLYQQVGADSHKDDPSSAYWNLMRLLHKKQFVFWVPNDDNRAADGRELRKDYLRDHPTTSLPDGWLTMNCSMLELLVAMAQRLAFQMDSQPRYWFMELLNNLGLFDHRDSLEYSPDQVEDILDVVIWRTYDYDGRGGLFPLVEPLEDQREVELWDQMNSYLLERY